MAVESLPVFYTAEFKRNLRQLAKKYRHIREDIQPVIDEFVEGSKPGDQIQGVRYRVFKVRVKNSDALGGKSGGYRIIYQEKPGVSVILITIYSKTEQADVAAAEIRRIIKEYDAAQKEEKNADD